MTKEELIENINFGSVLILFLSGFLHIITMIIYGNIYGAQGMFAYGVIYIILGILSAIKKDNKIFVILSIVFPILGLVLLFPILLPILDAFIIFLQVLDVIIIILRTYCLIQLFKKE